MVVKPGMVLISLTYSLPGRAVHEEVDARHAGAVDRAEHLDREPLHFGRHVRRQVGRDDRPRVVVEILGLVIVELARWDHFAGNRHLGIVVAEHGDLDFACVGHRGFDDDLSIELRGQVDRRGQVGIALRFRDADARTEIGRLDEHGIAKRGRHVLRDAAGAAFHSLAKHDEIVRLRQPSRRKHQLRDRLVHADRRREHACADIGDVRKLEQPLNRAVLAVRAHEGPETPRRAQGR